MVIQLANFVYLLLTGDNNFSATKGDDLFKALLGYFACWFGEGKATALEGYLNGIVLSDYKAWAVVLSFVLAWVFLIGLVCLVVKVIKRCFGA